MEARGKTYRMWMTNDTPVIVRVHADAQVPHAFLAMATFEFRPILDEVFNMDHLEHATFEGSDRISGVIVTHWNNA